MPKFYHLVLCTILAVAIVTTLTHSRILPAQASSIAVSFKVGDTRFTISGITSPLAQVTLIQDSAVIGTTVADSLGNFTLTVNVPSPGIVTYTTYATDTAGYSSDSQTFTLNALGNINTLYSGVILNVIVPTPSPTTTPTPATSAKPNSSPSPTSTAIASATAVPTAIASEAAVISTIAPSPSPTTVPFLTPFLDPTSQSLKSSFLETITTLWVKSWRSNPESSPLICDLNGDHVCNLIDFSILLYYIDR